MNAAVSFDPTEALRDAVTGNVAAHIEALCAVKRTSLVKGTPMTVAKNMVKAWAPKALQFFWVMAHQKNDLAFPSKSAVAKSLKWTEKALTDFWRRTLGGARIRVKDIDGIEATQREIEVFKRGRERRFSGHGIALYLGLNQPSYAAATSMYSSTLEATCAFRDNLEGAMAAIEANDALTEAERQAPRQLLAEREESVIRGPQLSLAVNEKK